MDADGGLRIAVNCWPTPSNDGTCDVNIEYELEAEHVSLHDVVISIPLPYVSVELPGLPRSRAHLIDIGMGRIPRSRRTRANGRSTRRAIPSTGPSRSSTRRSGPARSSSPLAGTTLGSSSPSACRSLERAASRAYTWRRSRASTTARTSRSRRMRPWSSKTIPSSRLYIGMFMYSSARRCIDGSIVVCPNRNVRIQSPRGESTPVSN